VHAPQKQSGSLVHCTTATGFVHIVHLVHEGSDHMKAHVQEQHSIKYDEYAELSDERMKTFFDGSFATESARRAASVFGRSHEGTALTFYIDKPTLVNVLGDLLFDPGEDEDAAIQTCPVSARIKPKRERFLAP
jgi:hypothetical protein